MQLTRTVILICFSILLSACVTETYQNGIKQRAKNTKEAALESAKVRVSLGLRYLEKGDTAQAKFNLAKALKLAPQLDEAHYSFAYYYQVVGEPVLAEKYYRQALDLSPKNGDVLNNYGVFLCTVGRFDEAELRFKEAIALTQYIRVAQSYENLAECALEQGKLTAASEYYTLALENNAPYSKVMRLQAEIAYRQQRYVDALSILNTLNQAQPAPDLMLSIHIVLLELERVAEAYQYAQMLMTDFPTSAEALLYKNDRLHESRYKKLAIK